jgi:calcineurin-like phosphoesterase family protein
LCPDRLALAVIPILWQSLVRWFRRFIHLRKRGAIFVFSDTHFNHKKILKYCNRPFSNVREMNEALVSRWNSVVSGHDHVYFLGDFVFHGSVGYWAHRLNGKIHFIRGNHDRRLRFARRRKLLKYGGGRFMLVHDPAHVPVGWTGWVIHGHTHNNRLAEFPFINGDAKRINVSAELVGYMPVRLDDLLGLEPDTIVRMDTAKSRPVRKENGK